MKLEKRLMELIWINNKGIKNGKFNNRWKKLRS